MGFKEIALKLPTDYSSDEVTKEIGRILKIRNFSWTIEKKSLDARSKRNIHWLIRVGVSSKELKEGSREPVMPIDIDYKKRDLKAVVTGSGPAGFFAAYLLQLSGFEVKLLEMGPDVETRKRDIASFEKTGLLNDRSNYSFGEGGAGTFSDGKLTSRTKSISREKAFIFDTYIKAGAPEEIAYLSMPHLGSDNLKKIVKNLRDEFEKIGGKILFNTKVTNIKHKEGIVSEVVTDRGCFESDYAIFATGHSSFDTFRMLHGNGVLFRNKPFAIGVRVEHEQAIINRSQWGCSSLKGVKGAEYKLTYKDKNALPVYSFCMCPGGKVVPAAPSKGLNIVNGMSNYTRNSNHANSAIVAGINISEVLKKDISILESLNWLETLERSFFSLRGNYDAPANLIGDFIKGKTASALPESSYPFGIFPYDFGELLPSEVVNSLQKGMTGFSKKFQNFDRGIMLGLESKTSSPIQAVRDKTGIAEGFSNLYISGEGSGYAGGIVSSAADGIKAAINIIEKN